VDWSHVLVGLLILTYWAWGVYTGYSVVRGTEKRDSTPWTGKFIHYHGWGFIIAMTVSAIGGLVLIFAEKLGGALLTR